MSKYDFHVHSVYSDGKFTLEKLIALAKEKGLKGLALTDHDSTNGVAELLELAKEAGLRAIPGVEITTEFENHRLDILGYGIDIDNKKLQERLAKLKWERNSRNQRLIKKLLELGFELDLNKIKVEEASPGGLGSQKAGLMVLENPKNHKLITEPTQNGLFREYLGRGGKAYIPLTDFSSIDAIKLIHECGGIASFAHPAQSVKNFELLGFIISELAGAGLDGIEVYSPKHDMEHIVYVKHLAEKYKLITTFGSDFHGKDEMHADLGGLDIPNEDNIVEKFFEKLKVRV